MKKKSKTHRQYDITFTAKIKQTHKGSKERYKEEMKLSQNVCFGFSHRWAESEQQTPAPVWRRGSSHAGCQHHDVSTMHSKAKSKSGEGEVK